MANRQNKITICDLRFAPCCVPRTPPTLTFSHWSGVTPYTFSYEFAGSCVFGKQSPGILLLQPLDSLLSMFVARSGPFSSLHILRNACKERGCPEQLRAQRGAVEGQLLSLTYECFFVEFLGEHSPVRLGLLDLPTCVGLRYGLCT